MKRTFAIALSATLMLALASSVQAQDLSPWETAQQEMEDAFGRVPSFFNSIPEHLRVAAWEQMKAYEGPETTIPSKYMELIGLAVASQIPCSYCIYAHAQKAAAFGASETEISEAVAQAAYVRYWSTIINGAQTDIEAFKKEWAAMAEHASAAAR